MHVEASIVGSIVLAGGVLKLGILYFWNFRHIMLVGLLVIGSVYSLLVVMDGKCYAAFSSVLHITLCVLVGIVVILLVRYMHVIISPLIFIGVYVAYVHVGSRFYEKSGVIIMIL